MRDLVMVPSVMKRAQNVKSDDMVPSRWEDSIQLSFLHYSEASVKYYKVRWWLATSKVTALSESHTTIVLPASTQILWEVRNSWMFFEALMAVLSSGWGARVHWMPSPFFVLKCHLKCVTCVNWPHLLVLSCSCSSSSCSFIISIESFFFFLDIFGSFKADLGRGSVELNINITFSK